MSTTLCHIWLTRIAHARVGSAAVTTGTSRRGRAGYDRGVADDWPSVDSEQDGRRERTRRREVRSRGRPRSDSLLRLRSKGSEQVHFDRETVEGLLSSGEFFWLDLDRPTRRLLDPQRRLQVPPARGRGLRALRPARQDRRLRRLRLHRRLRRRARRGPARRGALLLLRALPRHRPPRRLPRLRRDPRAATPSTRARRARAAAPLPVVDGLVDSFFPLLAEFDDRIDSSRRDLRGPRPRSCRPSSPCAAAS